MDVGTGRRGTPGAVRARCGSTGCCVSSRPPYAARAPRCRSDVFDAVIAAATPYLSGPQPSALRIRASETGWAVPSCWAHRLTRYSSSIQRTAAGRPPAGALPAGRRRGAARPAGALDPVHQLAVAGRLAEPVDPRRHRPAGSAGSPQRLRTRLGRRSRRDQPCRAGRAGRSSPAAAPSRRGRAAPCRPDATRRARAAPAGARLPTVRQLGAGRLDQGDEASGSRTGRSGRRARRRQRHAVVREQAAHDRVRRRGQPQLGRVVEPVERARRRVTGRPAAAVVVRRAGAGPPARPTEAATRRPDGGALVDQGRGSRAPRGPARVRVNDGSMVPNVHVVCPVAAQPGLVGRLPHRPVEGGPQRLLERLEVLAAPDLTTLVVDAPGRSVAGARGTLPRSHASAGTCTPLSERR